MTSGLSHRSNQRVRARTSRSDPQRGHR